MAAQEASTAAGLERESRLQMNIVMLTAEAALRDAERTQLKDDTAGESGSSHLGVVAAACLAHALRYADRPCRFFLDLTCNASDAGPTEVSATLPPPAGLSCKPGETSYSAVWALLPAPEPAAHSPACAAIPGPASQPSDTAAGDISAAATSSGGASIDASCDRPASASCGTAQTSSGESPSSGTTSPQSPRVDSSVASRPQQSAQLQGNLQCRSNGPDAADDTVDSDQALDACSGALAACVLQRTPAGLT